MTKEQNIKDTISRTDMMDAIGHGTTYTSEELQKIITNLPPVNPKSCENAINREVVLSKIKEVCFSKEWLQFRVNNGSNGQRDFLINYIKQLPSVTQKSGWIPVSEPPKELGTYLIQTDGEPYMCQCRWTDVNPFRTEYKNKPHWNIFDLPQYSKVVAWMPLPAKYEPQKSEVEE